MTSNEAISSFNRMNKFQQINWYETPKYYDIVFDDDTTIEADFLESVYERYVLSKGRQVLEPACGSGRLVAELADRGFQVCGYDVSKAMLTYARQRLNQRGLKAILKHMKFTDFSFGQRLFDMAHCLVSSFKHILTESEARLHLSLMADVLRPGGVYVLGLHLSEYSYRGTTLERWEVKREGCHIICNIRTWPPNRKTRTSRFRARLTVQELGQIKQLESNWVARTYGPRQLKSLISAEPRFEILCCYGFDYDIERTLPLEGGRLDLVLIIRKTPDRSSNL